jgi:uncharacterized protein (TIGR03435 family)
MRGALTIVFGIGFAALAQAPPAIRFEVASIRPAEPGFLELDNPSFVAYRAGKATSFCEICISGTHYDYYRAPLKELIGEAFRIDSRLVVAPDWLNQPSVTMFAIHALMPEGATKKQIPEMLKALLEERFHLVAHFATAEQTGYSLVVAKNGPKLKPPREMDRSVCGSWVEGIPLSDGSPHLICQSTREEGDRTVRTVMNLNGEFGPMLSEMSRGETFDTHTEYFRITMPQLAENLARDLSTVTPHGGTVVQVVDKTGIGGPWNVVIDKSLGDLALPTVSASLEKQGLRLEKTSVPTQKLIVDKVDRVPTEN